MDETQKERKLKFFIAYESTKGKDIAKHLKKSLEKDREYVEEAFIDEDIAPGTRDEENYRKTKIKNADYFGVILTPRAWEMGKGLREEIEWALSFDSDDKPNFLQIVQMKNADIPECLKKYQRVTQLPLETKEEVARELDVKNLLEKRKKDDVENLLEKRIEDEPQSKFMKLKEQQFVNEIKKIIERNKTIYFYSPVPFSGGLNHGYKKTIGELLEENVNKKDKAVFILFCWDPFIKKIKETLKGYYVANDTNLDDEGVLLNRTFLGKNIFFEKSYTKIILNFDSILQTPSNDEGIILGDDSQESIIWWKLSHKEEIWAKYRTKNLGIKELFTRNYDKMS